MLDPYKISGDAFHLFAFLILLGNLWIYESAADVSVKTQTLYVLALCAPCLYFFVNSPPIPLYNTLYIVAYSCLSFTILASIYRKFHNTYDKESDGFRIEILIFAALVLAFVCNHGMEPLEILRAFSEYLECVAAWPQFYMIMKTKKVRIGVFLYLLALGIYRSLYVQSWIHRYNTEGYYDAISDTSGSIQVVPYVAFLALCLIGVVKITCERPPCCTQNDQKGISTVEVPPEEGTSQLSANVVDVVRDGCDQFERRCQNVTDIEKVTKKKQKEKA